MRGDYLSIDMSAVKKYMVTRGLTVEGLAKMVGLTGDEAQQLQTFV